MRKQRIDIIGGVLGLVLLLGLVTGAAAQQVAPGSQILAPEEVRRLLEEYLAANRDRLPAAEVRFRSLVLPEPMELPAGELQVEIVPSDPQLLGSRRFTLIVRVDGRVQRNLALRAELEALAPVAVAAQDLRRGTVLTREDIRLVTMDLAQLRYPALDPQELVGKRTKRTLRLGEPFDRGGVEFPPLVRRGDLVTITGRGAGLVITATGIARADGEEGDFIRVRNSNSQREVLCRVAAPGEVEVEF